MNGKPVKKADSKTAVKPAEIPLCKPYVSEEEELAVVETLRSGWLMQGSKVAELERLIAEYVGVKHAIAVNSGTSALTLALMAIGLKPGEKTIMPSHSFVATANSTVHCGGEPIFVDIAPEDYNIDPSSIEPVIDAKTRVIVVVHQIGFPADMEPIESIAKERRLAIIEDAACSLGASYRGKQTGGFGEVACLSFHPRKILTMGEGGMVLTDSESIAQRIKSLRNHGLAVSAEGAALGCVEAGYNYRMTDIQAAIGIVQFRKLEEIIKLRTRLAERYMEAISKLPALKLRRQVEDTVPNYQSFAVELTDDSINRNELLAFMNERGIQAAPGIQPIHTTPLYAEKYSDISLPETMRAALRSFFLPLYPGMADEQQESVIACLSEALDRLSSHKGTA